MGLFSKLFKSKEVDRPAPKERDALSIKVGDIITYDLRDFEVVGKITYQDGSYKWYGYQLLEGHDTIWLAAEMDDELELGIYRKIQLAVDKPFPKKLEYDGKTYQLEEEGRAAVTGEGRSSNLHGSETHYADYSDKEDENHLSIESWGTEFEVSYGFPIEAYEIKILAGSK